MKQGKRARNALRLAAAGLLVAATGVLAITGPAQASGDRQLISRGSSTPTATSSGVRFDGLRGNGALAEDGAGGANGPNRSEATRGGRHTSGTTSLRVDSTTPGLGRSFTGLGITDDARAAGFVLEPPDQGLCVGNGKVLELVNVVGQVYSTAGAKVGGAFYLNDFFHEDPNQANASDPSCYYDADTNRFYADMLFYDSDPKTGQLNGENRIDIAVSNTSDPSGSWRVFGFDVTGDGPSDFNLGDYPQIGADAQGLYITTNSYPFFEDGFGGAQLYAMSKRGVATGSDLRVSRVALGTSRGATAFGLRPTTAPAAGYAREFGGTEYLLSSQATPEAGNKQGFSQAITLWALTGTDSLAPHASRALKLKTDAATVDRYGIPPLSEQKAGDYPLGQCLSVQPCRQQTFRTTSAAFPHSEGKLDSSDSRMNQTVYANGLVYGTVDTVVNVGGKDRAGLAYYVLRPDASAGGVLKGDVVKQGKLALAGNNLTFGAFGVNRTGRAVLALNVVGTDYYASAGYVTFDAKLTPGPVHIAGAGVGPTDGFSEYPDFTGGTVRPRWGDYAATSFDPATGSIWIANEYIAQSCTLATYQADPSCGGTRSRYGNWSTRISQVTPAG